MVLGVVGVGTTVFLQCLVRVDDAGTFHLDTATELQRGAFALQFLREKDVDSIGLYCGGVH